MKVSNGNYMNYEVEQKFAVQDKAAFSKQLDALGVQWQESVRQEDAYFNHPSRDFAATDEALRVRIDGDRAMFTYKGPRIDSTTKTRQELELLVSNPDTEGQNMRQFLSNLGFTYVHSVVKQRKKGTLSYQQRAIEVALDEVEGLGSFVEFELVVLESELEQATASLAQFTQSLGLTDGITTGYLDMLLR